MEYTVETTVMLPGRSFNIQVVEDVDYLLDLVKTDDDVPFWAVLWPAAIAMAEYFWENINLEGKMILELGAGLGLVGIIAAAKGGNITQTDFIPEALKLAQENARANGINNITYVLADWRKFAIEESFDWILGSDILYEPKLHPYLKDIFTKSLKAGGTLALADPGRDDARKFIDELRLDGYQVQRETKSVFEAGRKVQVSLYLLKKQ